MRRLIAITGFVLAAWALPAPAGAAEDDAAGLLEKTGVKGGICLVIGAKDMALA